MGNLRRNFTLKGNKKKQNSKKHGCQNIVSNKMLPDKF